MQQPSHFSHAATVTLFACSNRHTFRMYEALRNLAVALRQMQQISASVAVYDGLIASNPKDQKWLIEKGLVEMEAGACDV
jgi:hypothetical protein